VNIRVSLSLQVEYGYNSDVMTDTQAWPV